MLHTTVQFGTTLNPKRKYSFIVCPVILLIGLLPFCKKANKLTQLESEYVNILNSFNQWKMEQIREGVFLVGDSCNFEVVSRDGSVGSIMGIPFDLDISYTDINQDGKVDGLVLFRPNQCDGGNALMNIQIKLLILSSPNKYIVDDKFMNVFESQNGKGWFILDNATEGTIYGTYYEYTETDGRCCPSIRRKISIYFSSKKLEFE